MVVENLIMVLFVVCGLFVVLCWCFLVESEVWVVELVEEVGLLV